MTILRKSLQCLYTRPRFIFIHRGKVTHTGPTNEFISKIQGVPLFYNESRDELLTQSMSFRSPAVSTVISKTVSPESTASLARWQKIKKKELGYVGFSRFVQNMKSVGGVLHGAIARHLDGKGISGEVSPQIEGYYRSIRPILDEVESVLHLEHQVEHPDLCYKGRMDGLLVFNSTPMIIEWKTVHSNRRVTSIGGTYDAPIQMVAYLGAYNRSVPIDKQVDLGLLVYAYPDGHLADLIPLNKEDLEIFWAQWLTRLHKYFSDQMQASLEVKASS